MKSIVKLTFPIIAALAASVDAGSDEEFYGKIESRPLGKAGTWTIGGRQVAVTDATKLDEEDGPLVVGACAEVEYKGGAVKEIESEDEISKCAR
jgi:hypothetical protein